MLNVNELYCNLNSTGILNDISFSAQAGELIGIIGANGAGKSTLLKCLCGIHRYRGAIDYCNNPLTKMTAAERAKTLSYMEQGNDIDFPFSVREIVMMGRYPHINRLQGASATDERIVDSALADANAQQFAERDYLQLSGGEKQRVQFARILAQQTPMLLLDEPVSALDIACKEALFSLMKQQAQSGKLVITTLHDIKDAARYCSRLLVMKAGQIIADGAPTDILDNSLIREAYGLDTVVYHNRISGGVDYFVHKRGGSLKNLRVHIVCGGGTGSGVARFLLEEGARVSMGVLIKGDSDLEYAELTGITTVSEKPFSPISEKAGAENIRLISQADLTILTNIPFGTQTIRNLEACGFAKKLIIFEDDAISQRDYSGGVATTLYNNLRTNAVVTATAQLPALFETEA